MEYRICFKSVKPYCVYVGLRKRTYFKAFQAFGCAGASQENQRSAQGAKGSKRMILCLAGHKQVGAGALRHSAHRGATHASHGQARWDRTVPSKGSSIFFPFTFLRDSNAADAQAAFCFTDHGTRMETERRHGRDLG